MSSRSLSRLVTGATVALLAPVLSFVAAAPVSAAELTGSIVVSVEVEGRSAPLDGWQLTLSSANCAVPTAATATTDSTGAATFDGLTMFADESSTTPCLYDVEQERRDGFEQDTDDAELTGLTAGTLVPTTTSGIAVASASGVFVNPTRNPEPKGNVLDYKCLTGIGTSEVRSGWHPLWRDCSLAPQNQTGLGFTANPTPEGEELPLGESTVATLTHFNQTILRGVHNYDLVTSFTFADRATGQTQTVDRTYTVRIDETSDSGYRGDLQIPGRRRAERELRLRRPAHSRAARGLGHRPRLGPRRPASVVRSDAARRYLWSGRRRRLHGGAREHRVLPDRGDRGRLFCGADCGDDPERGRRHDAG